MKPSRYNHFFPYSDTQCIAYNALTNSLALIEKPKLDAYRAYCDNGTPLPEDLVTDLKKGLFLLEDHVDELDTLRYNMLRGRYATDSISLTIAPTNDCNFRCVYCYEKDAITSKYMSQEVQDKLVELLESRKDLISSFGVTWYGGEPLMAFDVMESLSRRFIEICKENNIMYQTNMITNGYLLSREVLARMQDLCLSHIQVTIDGLPEVHNQNRPLVGGGDTFDTIINNLKDGYDLLPPVALRINIDKNNISAGENIYKLLHDNNMLEKVRPYFGKIIDDAGTHDSSLCLTGCDFSEIEFDFFQRTVGDEERGPTQYPSLKSAFCGADCVSSQVIDAEGWMYKCWCDIGIPERRVGSIIEKDYIATSDLLFKYMLYDPTTCDMCKDCDVLPICMGGCPFKRLSGSVDNCVNHKYILEKCLRDSVVAFQRMRKQAEEHKDKACDCGPNSCES